MGSQPQTIITMRLALFLLLGFIGISLCSALEKDNEEHKSAVDLVQDRDIREAEPRRYRRRQLKNKKNNPKGSKTTNKGSKRPGSKGAPRRNKIGSRKRLARRNKLHR